MKPFVCQEEYVKTSNILHLTDQCNTVCYWCYHDEYVTMRDKGFYKPERIPDLLSEAITFGCEVTGPGEYYGE